MDSILVTPRELRDAARTVDEYATDFYNEYQGLFNTVETFTTTDYKGTDATAFCKKVKNFEPDFRKMRELMNEYANFLRQAADNYERTQQNAITAINSLR